MIVWVDTEKTGNDENKNHLLQISIVITDNDGNLTSEKDKIICTRHADNEEFNELFAESSSAVKRMHDHSGIWDSCYSPGTKNSFYTYKQMDNYLWRWLDERIGEFPTKDVYFGGNSVTVDRNFVRKFLPSTFSLISSQSIDCATLRKTFSGIIPEFEYGYASSELSNIMALILEYNHFRTWAELRKNAEITY